MALGETRSASTCSGCLSAAKRNAARRRNRRSSDFDRKLWRKLLRKLPAKARFFPLESVVFQRQALEKLNEAVALYQKARKSPSSVAWHRTRIGIKRFRYIVENFLPQRYEVWSSDMKQMQDLLGEVHDLDVLRADIKQESPKLAPMNVAEWLEKIGAERKQCLAEFRLKTPRKDSPWLVWRAGISVGPRFDCGVAYLNRRAASYAS